MRSACWWACLPNQPRFDRMQGSQPPVLRSKAHIQQCFTALIRNTRAEWRKTPRTFEMGAEPAEIHKRRISARTCFSLGPTGPGSRYNLLVLIGCVSESSGVTRSGLHIKGFPLLGGDVRAFARDSRAVERSRCVTQAQCTFLRTLHHRLVRW